MVRVHSLFTLFIASVDLGHGLGGEVRDDTAKECDGMDVVSYTCAIVFVDHFFFTEISFHLYFRSILQNDTGISRKLFVLENHHSW